MKKNFLLFGTILLIAAGCNKTPDVVQPPIDELSVKAYLIEKYDPGTHSGMPTGVDPEEVHKAVQKNTQLTTFIKQRFELPGTADIYVYEKILQFGAVTLTKTSSGYEYNILDGRGCSVITYKGTVTISGSGISNKETSKDSQNIPC